MTATEKLLAKMMDIYHEAGTNAVEFHGRFSIECQPEADDILGQPDRRERERFGVKPPG